MSGRKRKKAAVPLEQRRVCDLEVEIWQAVQRRAKRAGGYPDHEAIRAMEEPLRRLVGASLLLRDLALGADNARKRVPPLSTGGLVVLSQVMEREAGRLNSLYHGKRADNG